MSVYLASEESLSSVARYTQKASLLFNKYSHYSEYSWEELAEEEVQGHFHGNWLDRGAVGSGAGTSSGSLGTGPS